MAPELAKSVFYETRRRVFRLAAEKVVRPIKLELRTNVTLGSAQEEDSVHGNYFESANQYHSLLEGAKAPSVLLEATIGLSQQLINLGRYGQAKEYLVGIDIKSLAELDLTARESDYYFAKAHEKLGWIADLEGDYTDSVQHFSLARAFVLISQDDGWNKNERELYSTTTHFLGRANYGLAISGIGGTSSIERSLEFFNEDLSYNEELGRQGDKRLDVEAYGHAWLARCYLLKKDLGRAKMEVFKASELFAQYYISHPERGIMAYKHMLVGGLEFYGGNFVEARENFEQAFRIRRTKEPYPKGEAEALLGIAGTYWAERNFAFAFTFFINAIKTYPLSIIRPSL